MSNSSWSEIHLRTGGGGGGEGGGGGGGGGGGVLADTKAFVKGL